MNTAVHRRELEKEFGSGQARVLALRGVDFDVRFGETTFLVGPSGCGKTTLLSVVAGLLDSSGGEVKLFGENVESFRPDQRHSFSPEKPWVLKTESRRRTKTSASDGIESSA
jgi:ABC-type sugar transport system ATPase subunit